MTTSTEDNAQETVQLKVTVQNISGAREATFSPFWVGFHDGSFDTFTPGEAASRAIEIVAEDGIIGLEPTTPEFDQL